MFVTFITIMIYVKLGYPRYSAQNFMYISQHILTMTVPSNEYYERYTETCASFYRKVEAKSSGSSRWASLYTGVSTVSLSL